MILHVLQEVDPGSGVFIATGETLDVTPFEACDTLARRQGADGVRRGFYPYESLRLPPLTQAEESA